MTKREKAFLIFCAALLAVSVTVKYAKTGSVWADPAPIPPGPTLIAPSLSEVGIELIDISTLPSDEYIKLKSSAIDQSNALVIAHRHSMMPPDRASSIDAKLYLFSNSNYGTADENGKVQPFFQRRLAGVVIYQGVVPPVSVPVGGTLSGPPNTEFNVVIDAITGEYLQAFTYR